MCTCMATGGGLPIDIMYIYAYIYVHIYVCIYVVEMHPPTLAPSHRGSLDCNSLHDAVCPAALGSSGA